MPGSKGFTEGCAGNCELNQGGIALTTPLTEKSARGTILDVIMQAKENVRSIQSSIEGIEETITKPFFRLRDIGNQLSSDVRTMYEKSREAVMREMDRYK